MTINDKPNEPGRLLIPKYSRGRRKMKKNILVLMGILVLLTPNFIQAAQEETYELEEIVVTASKTEELLKNTSSSVTVITEEDIKEQKANTVLEVLRNVVGLDIVQSGGQGKTTSVFIRGGNSGHTLVLIDGVQVNSPTLGSYSFADLTTDNIERIEIVKGAQSTLYGSDAVTGVINIITKKGEGKLKSTVSVEAGSYSTHKETASLSGSNDKINYSLCISNYDTEGISAANEKDGNTEADGYKNITLSARLGFTLPKSATIDLFLRYTDAESELDNLGSDDLNYVQDTQSLIASVNYNQMIIEQWAHSLKLSLTDENLKYEDPDTSWNNSTIETQIRNVDWQHNFYLFEETNTLTLGLEYEEQEGENEGVFDESIDNKAGYLQNQISLLDETLFMTGGIRTDDHSKFGSDTNYKLSFAYLLKEKGTKIRSSWGTAFKAPTLNDLFYQDSYGNRGNPDLKPEESKSYDVGLEQNLWKDKISIGISYFYNEFDNLIEWIEYDTWAYEPRNVDQAETKGWELETVIELLKNLELGANYTYTQSKDKSTGNELVRRPENKVNITTNYLAFDKLNLNLGLNYVGDRWNDEDNTEKMDSYNTVDIATSYDITKQFQIFGRIENLFDEEYEEVKGYGTPGISYYGGIKAIF